MSQLTLNDLNRVSFEFENKIYDVVDVEKNMQKNYIRTKQRTFVYFDSDLESFLSKINIVEKKACSVVSETAPVSVVNVVRHEIVLPAENKQVMDKLFEMFNKLSDSPTENDYKQAKAMSEITESIVKVAQMNINLLRLQKSL